MIGFSRKLRVGWNFLLCAAMVIYTTTSYNVGGFGLGMGALMLLCALVVSTQTLILFRRVGTLVGWSAMFALFLLAVLTTDDLGTGVLIAAFSIAAPLSVSIFWPTFKGIGALSKRALPLGGGILFLGTLVYNGLHFGNWDFSSMLGRTTQKMIAFTDQWEQMMNQIYGGELPEQMIAYAESFREQAGMMAYNLLLIPVFALFGIFFIAIFLADRKAKKEGASRWCGSWRALIPPRRISWLYMLINIISIFAGERLYLPLTGALNLFGFFYVFTAVYKLERFLAKKKLHGFWRGAIVVILFALSFITVGGSTLTPYTLLLFAGWWIATTPAWVTVIRK